MRTLILLFVLGLGLNSIDARGEEKVLPPRWALKSNMLYLATTTPNLGVEYAFSEKISLEITAGYNPFYFGSKEENKKLQHWLVRPEVRWWYCQKYTGSFWGVNGYYGRFNAGGIKPPFGAFPSLEKYRREGTVVGSSLRYGYHFMLSARWSLETSLSVGYAYLKYDKYDCGKCGKYHSSKEKHYVGPTGLAVSLVYLF